MQIWGGQFRKRISTPRPWHKSPCHSSIFLHARLNVRKKNEKNLIFRPKFDLFCVLSSQNMRTYPKMFYMSFLLSEKVEKKIKKFSKLLYLPKATVLCCKCNDLTACQLFLAGFLASLKRRG